MNPRIDPAAIVAVTMLVAVAVSGVAGAAISTDEQLLVGVTQDGTDVTVDVTANDTAVENASVTVEAVNATYAGEGAYVTDVNGTVSLPSPSENVTVEVTAEKANATGSTTVDLVAVEDDEPEFGSFGQRVSWFVHSLLGDEDTEGGIGQAVSEFVTSNNPSNDNKPDHAGKPDDAGNSENGKSNGGGPPEHAKQDKNDKNNDKTDEEDEDDDQ